MLLSIAYFAWGRAIIYVIILGLGRGSGKPKQVFVFGSV
jgi:hypothetical protein